jgi:hypothetical protein
MPNFGKLVTARVAGQQLREAHALLHEARSH